MDSASETHFAPSGQAVKTKSASSAAFFITLLAIFIIIPTVAVAGVFGWYSFNDWIIPQVQVGPVAVGNLNVDQAAQKIDAYWNQTPHLVVTDGTHTWSIVPTQIGLWVDPTATAQAARQLGRGENGLQTILAVLRASSTQVPPVVQFQPQVAQDVLLALASSLDQPPVDAKIVFAGGHWTVAPAQTGYGLDVNAVVAAIQADPQRVLQEDLIVLPVKPVAARVQDLSGEVARLEAVYQKPLQVSAYDPISDETFQLTLPQERVASWIVLENPQDEPHLQADRALLESEIIDWVASLGGRELETMPGLDDLSTRWRDQRPLEVMLRRLPTEYPVSSGENLISIAFKVGMPYWKIQEANPGIDIYGVHAGQTLTIPSKNEMLPYPVVKGKRIVLSITDQHMWVYENGDLWRDYVISTGMSNSPTLPGVFQIQTHEINAYASKWDLWMPNFMGIYEAVPGFMNGIHGLPLLSSGVRLWGNVLGTPASYGCIILDLKAGEELYAWADQGVVVEIRK